MSGAASEVSCQIFVEKVTEEEASVGQAVEALFSSLPAAGRLGPDVRVLLKPNLLRKNAPEKAVTTHPLVVGAVLDALQRRGVRQVVIADSPGGPYSASVMEAVYRQCGYEAFAGREGVSLYTACQSKEVKSAGRLVQQFNVIQPVVDSDFIINLPKMKTHVMTVMTGAVKNLFGCVPGLQKAEFHLRFPEREDFGAMLVDLCETVKADIHLVDGILAMEGDGPGGGVARRCNLLLAGEDPYLMDLALCRYMAIDPMITPVLAEAAKRGLCPRALDEAALQGSEEAKRPFEDFAPPRSYNGRLDFSSSLPSFMRPMVEALSRRMAPHPVINKGRCIGCMKCGEICPHKVISLKNGKAVIDKAGCIRCFCCHEVCPVQAVDIKKFSLLSK